MSAPSIEDVQALCREHGWPEAGGDHDLLRWLRNQLEERASLQTHVDSLEDAVGEAQCETSVAEGKLEELRATVQRLLGKAESLASELKDIAP